MSRTRRAARGALRSSLLAIWLSWANPHPSIGVYILHITKAKSGFALWPSKSEEESPPHAPPPKKKRQTGKNQCRSSKFSGFRRYGPRPSSIFTSQRPDEATNPTTLPRCPFSSGLALRPCSSTRVPMGMGEVVDEVEGADGGDAAAADVCCSRCNRIK